MDLRASLVAFAVNIAAAIAGGIVATAARHMFIDIHHEVGLVVVSALAVANSAILLRKIGAQLRPQETLKTAIVHGAMNALAPIALISVIVPLTLVPLVYSSDTPLFLQELCTVLIGGLVCSGGVVLSLTPSLILVLLARRKSR